MKAVTLWEPWASAVAAGLKRNETRSWSTEYRGELAIHSARRRFGRAGLEATVLRSLNRRERDILACHIEGDPFDPDSYPLGRVVAVAELVDVRMVAAGSLVPVLDDGERINGLTERRLGDYRPSRYVWRLEEVVALPVPIPAVGARQLWEWRAA